MGLSRAVVYDASEYSRRPLLLVGDGWQVMQVCVHKVAQGRLGGVLCVLCKLVVGIKVDVPVPPPVMEGLLFDEVYYTVTGQYVKCHPQVGRFCDQA